MMAPISFADKVTLEGERVILRPVAVGDAAGLFAISEESRRLTGSHAVAESIEPLEDWYRTRADHDDRLDLAIVPRVSGQWAGEVVLNEVDQGNRSCNFRILLDGPSSYGQGYGTEATRLILAHAFETVGLHRIDLEVYAFNPRARHVYEKVGFVLEGTKRQSLRWDGQSIDAHVMSILAPEWREHRGYPV